MTRTKTVLALTLFFSLAFSVSAQEKRSGDGQAGVPKLVMDSTTHEFGSVESGTPLTYTFKVKNEGTADLLITNVAPS